MGCKKTMQEDQKELKGSKRMEGGEGGEGGRGGSSVDVKGKYMTVGEGGIENRQVVYVWRRKVRGDGKKLMENYKKMYTIYLTHSHTLSLSLSLSLSLKKKKVVKSCGQKR